MMRKGRTKIFCSAVFAFFVALAGCSGTPPANQQSNVLRRSDVEQLAKAMQEQIEQHFTVLQHKLVNRYVNSLGQSIVARNPQMPPLPYQFRILRENEMNAFSLPGGIVYITLGMVSQLELEGQLAAAIAHELAHQDAGHALILWRDRIVRAQKWLTNTAPEDKRAFSGHYFGEGGLLSYGEKFESEADEIALVLLYQAGYDPRAYLSYLEELRRITRSSPKQLELINRLHPPLDERLAHVREYLKLLPPKQESKLTSATFKEVKHLLKLADKMKAKPTAKPTKKKAESMQR